MVLPSNVFEDARYGDVESIERWCAEGDRDVNDTTKSHDKSPGLCGLTLLHAAVIGTKSHDQSPGQCEMIRFLLAKGADVNKVTENALGMTPLYHAAFKAQYNASLLLLNAGAHVDVRAHSGFTALMAATNHGHCDLIRTLLRRGASLDARDTRDRNAEDIARENEKAEAAALLAEIRTAGGWRAYVRAPRARLVAHRSLCEKGRAIAPEGTILERLFAPKPPPATTRRTRKVSRVANLAQTMLPKEVFWHVLQFWRCDRDARD